MSTTTRRTGASHPGVTRSKTRRRIGAAGRTRAQAALVDLPDGPDYSGGSLVASAAARGPYRVFTARTVLDELPTDPHPHRTNQQRRDQYATQQRAGTFRLAQIAAGRGICSPAAVDRLAAWVTQRARLAANVGKPMVAVDPSASTT